MFHNNQCIALPHPGEISSEEERERVLADVAEARKNLQVNVETLRLMANNLPEECPVLMEQDGAAYQEPAEFLTLVHSDEKALHRLWPKHLLAQCLWSKGVNTYNRELCQLLDEYAKQVERLKFRSEYTVRVNVLEWREYEIKVEADDMEDLRNQIECCRDVNEFEHDGGEEGQYLEALPSRLEKLFLDDSLEECIVHTKPL
jgi:hypothetical protein